MITLESPEKTPALWPGGSLASFGLNPFGGNMWRVVWSESRTYMFKAEYGDGFNGFRQIPMYMNKKCYMLERWLSAFQYSKCTEERWNLMHEDQGPYPTRGVYFGPCWEFDGYPTLGAVEAIVGILTRCDEIPEYEKNLMMIKARETEKILEAQRAKEIILDSLPLDVTRGKLTDRFYRDAEDIPQRYSAQDLHKLTGLPIGEGKTFTSGAQRILES